LDLSQLQDNLEFLWKPFWSFVSYALLAGLHLHQVSLQVRR